MNPFGPFGNMMPYSNFHGMNLDWVIQIAKDFLDQYTSIQQVITEGEESLENLTESGLTALQDKADALEDLLQQWYDSHSQDIADELTQAITDFHADATAYALQVIESIPEDYTALSNKASELYTEMMDNFNSIDAQFTMDKNVYEVTPTATVEGWRLNSYDGLCTADADYQLLKYTVTAGDIIRVKSDDRFQFQNAASVPSSGLPNIVGTVHAKFDGLITVPATATYLIISTPAENGAGSMFKVYSHGITPFWNSEQGGIYIDGNSVVVNENGFGLYYNGIRYYIAPTDLETVSTFTRTAAGGSYVLVIDTTQLTNPNQRNNPSDVMSVINIPSRIDPKYIPVAYYFKTYWDFTGEFRYFKQGNNVLPFWNVQAGGIYIDGNSVIINENGFGIYYNGNRYYIAPTDFTTVTTFTRQSAGGSYILVIDPSALTNLNQRNNPSDVLSVIDITSRIDPNLIPVAYYFKTYWDFVGDFLYFKQGTMDEIQPYFRPQLDTFNLSAHRGLTTQTNNTIAAFQAAVNAGYRLVECDLRVTYDDEIILYHDATISGDTISSLTYAQIHAINPNIPTLTEMLLWAKKYKIIVELDCAGRLTDGQLEDVYDLCVKYGMNKSVLFTVYETEMIHLADSNMTSTNVCISFLGGTPTADAIAAIDNKVNMFINKSVSLYKTSATSGLIEACHNNGFEAHVWTLTTQQEAQTFYDLGADLLLCDASNMWIIN